MAQHQLRHSCFALDQDQWTEEGMGVREREKMTSILLWTGKSSGGQVREKFDTIIKSGSSCCQPYF